MKRDFQSRLLAATAVAASLCGCASYHARPLPQTPSTVSRLSELKVDPARLRVGPLQSIRVDARDGLDPTEIAVLAERELDEQAVVVRVEDCRSLARFDLNRHDLFSEDSRIVRALRFLLRAQRVLVLLLARDFVATSEILSRARHRCVAVGIKQCDHQAVFEFALAECEA